MGKSSFRNLIVWQKAMSLAGDVHRFTETFPPTERYGLTQQLRRAAVSIPSNIAEGRGRGTVRDYRQFLMNARGSVLGVQTQVLLASQFGYAPAEAAETLVTKAERVVCLINGLIRYLSRRL